MRKDKATYKTSDKAVSDHFVDVNKMVPIGSFPEIHAKATVDFVLASEKITNETTF